MEKVLVAGQWQESLAAGEFQATNPSTHEKLPAKFPVSSWSDVEGMLNGAAEAFQDMRRRRPEEIASFLERYAERLEGARDELVEIAHAETGLPRAPRLADVELPRTTGQLRKAAAAAISGDWSMPVLDTALGIRACYQSLGPVAVFGPNNFPFAFNGVAGGDFAAAIAAGNPVIAKASSSHPATTKRLAEEAILAVQESGLHPATVQMIYRLGHADGAKFVSDHRLGATGYTGARRAGLALKAAADAAGKPIYLELSSVNPVVITKGALQESLPALVDQYFTSVLMGAGQFCTNPGLLVIPEGDLSAEFLKELADRFRSAAAGTLLSPAVASSLKQAVEVLSAAGASMLAQGAAPDGPRCAFPNTLLQCSGEQFIADPEKFQTEAFGNAALVVVAKGTLEIVSVLESLEGNLTGCIYSATDGSEESDYDRIAFAMTPKVGRLLNDKMPTGVAVSPAMNHGGPYPATGHPGFTAVGIPASMLRFGKLTSFDNVRGDRLPAILRDQNPTGKTWRNIDGRWTVESL